MKQIDLSKIRRDNSNIRKYSDTLWRALRKERFKKADPNQFVNEMAAEQVWLELDENTDFKCDVEQFSRAYLSEREASIFALFLFGGKLGQVEIGEILGVCQSTVHNDLEIALRLFKEYYFGANK